MAPRMRSLVEAAVAADQTPDQIAECLNRESFRPVSNRNGLPGQAARWLDIRSLGRLDY